MVVLPLSRRDPCVVFYSLLMEHELNEQKAGLIFKKMTKPACTLPYRAWIILQ